MKRHYKIVYIAVVLIGLMLSACGGGGGGGDTASGKWDEMKWDQGTWQ